MQVDPSQNCSKTDQLRKLFRELSGPRRRPFHLIKADIAELMGHSGDPLFRIVGREKELMDELSQAALPPKP